jgi:hypothetical protein
MWSAAVLLPALPRRSVAARNSPVLSGERQHRVEPECLLERRRGLLLLAVTHHNGCVQVDDQAGELPASGRRGRERLAGELGALRPDDVAGRRPGSCDRPQPAGAEAVE